MMPPIFMSSVIKSGTWLLRQIVSEVSGLPWYEPEIPPGEIDYCDTGYVKLHDDRFFCWHAVPTAETRALLAANQAKVVLLTRNIFDLVVSIYRHFANDVDADIGRSTRTREFFSSMTREQGLSLIINGAHAPEFAWVGLGPQLFHMQECLTFAIEYPCCLMTFERLQSNREEEILKVANYLGVSMGSRRLAEIAANSSFSAMKEKAEKGTGGGHFQKGEVGRHGEFLSRYHVYMILHALRTHAPRLESLANRLNRRELIECAVP